uniref:glycerophosphodiester phosphodiesterase n=1 Tax=Ningiella ruwaisensis TaxID=2364274 RepID=UPI00109F8D6D|nr:glycerophosphodiester phosphodiesterase family protein [Ningiella ruwaisensis]
MLIIAHRGNSSRHIENTQPAFEQAIADGAKAIECDIHQVGGGFYVFHDFTLERLCNRTERLADLSEKQIKTLKVKGKHPILSMEELFDIVQGRVTINLGLKAINEPLHFIESLNRCITTTITSIESTKDETGSMPKNTQIDIVVSSFNHPMLASIKSALRQSPYNHQIRVAALVAHLPMDHAAYAQHLGADIAAIDAQLVEADFVEDAHNRYLDVWCYTVNREDDLLRLKAMGVDAVFSDDPAWARAVIKC